MFKYFGIILFFLMMSTPFEFYGVKIFIMILLFLHRIFIIIKKQKLELSKSIFYWFVTLIFFGFFFSFWSLFFPYSNINNVLKVLPVYFIWPIFYMLLIPYLLDEELIIILNKTMVMASLFISFYLILAFLSLVGLLPINFDNFTLVKPILGRSESVEAQLFMPAVTALLFLNPFLLTSILLSSHKKIGMPSIVVFCSFILTTIAILVTGRRSLMLNVLISPIIIWFFFRFAHVKLMPKERKKIVKILILLAFVGVCTLTYIAYTGLVDLGEFWSFFIKGFDLSSNSDDVGSSERGGQVSLMLKSWMDNPVLGSGLASSSEYVIRSESSPWMYELSYLALLFQTGIVGIVIYFSLLVWLFIKAIIIVRKNNYYSYIIPVFIGCFCFLVGCASNPYLQAFDHMWAIFLPAGLINYCNKNPLKGIK